MLCSYFWNFYSHSELIMEFLYLRTLPKSAKVSLGKFGKWLAIYQKFSLGNLFFDVLFFY